MPVAHRSAAFFDVDGTLVNTISLFSFLEFWFAALDRPCDEHLRFRQRLAAMTAAGVPRTETNRVYYSIYAGHDAAEVAAYGRSWFARELAGDGLFNPVVLDRLRRHAADGLLIVLVSGSFPACLDPIRDHVGADVMLCSLPEIRDGRYTGEIHEPMIGEAKAEAVRQLPRRLGLNLAESFGYGDHVSDLPILHLVGHPVQVGDDETLTVVAAAGGWPMLPAGLVVP